MRRGITVLVVVIVAAIAVAAGVDALRGGSMTGPEARAVSTTTGSEGPTNYVPLEDDELAGTLYYTDEDCELQAIELPGQQPAPAPNWSTCRFVLSPDATSVSGAGTAWDPTGDHLVRTRQGRIVVLSSDHEPEGSFPGAAAAWRPDGTLAYFAHGAVRTWPEGRTLLTQDDLAKVVRAHPDVPDNGHVRPVVVRELAWFDDHRAVVLLDGVIRGGPRKSLLGLFDDRQLVSMQFEEETRLSGLRVSPRRGFVGLRSGDSFLLLDERGTVLQTPILTAFRAITWSPDDRWAAVSAGDGVYVFRPGASEPPELELDLDAHDLVWRGDAGPPAFAGTDEAREWLSDAGTTGRLFVTQATGSACTLRALQLPDLSWAERPPGLPNPCRFTLDEDDVVLPGSQAPQPGGGQIAVCRNRAVEVHDEQGLLAAYPGCAPAWTPDGRLTFIRNGGLFEPTRPLLRRGEVGQIFGRPAALEEIAWVDDERFWAVLRSGAFAIVAFMTTDGLVFSPSFTAETIEGLRVSATGMVAARTDQGVVLFDSGGRRALTFPKGHAVTWAPGELIAAVATPSEILFVAPVSREAVTLPLAVRDLEWVVP
jgi:WD40-like Beta Propeller Repeat